MINMKKIFLLLCILFLTGCDVVYNINIGDNEIVESTDFYAYESDNVEVNINSDGTVDRFAPSLDILLDSYLDAEYNAFYHNSINKNLYTIKKFEDEFGMNLKYKFNYKNYSDSSLVNSCFKEVSVSEKGNNLTIDLKDASICFSKDSYKRLDSVKININTNLKVTDNNADSINGNIYTWDIDEDNAESKEVLIKLKKNIKYNNYIIYLVVFGSAVFAIILFIGFVRKRNEVNNQI